MTEIQLIEQQIGQFQKMYNDLVEQSKSIDSEMVDCQNEQSQLSQSILELQLILSDISQNVLELEQSVINISTKGESSDSFDDYLLFDIDKAQAIIDSSKTTIQLYENVIDEDISQLSEIGLMKINQKYPIKFGDIQSKFLEYEEQQISSFPNNIVDISMNQSDRSVNMILSNGNICQMNKYQVKINLPEIDQPKNDFPIQKYSGKLINKQIANYYPNKEQFQTNYSHAHNYKLLNKIIHDNDLKFGIDQFVTVYYDIETYNDEQYNEVPQFDNKSAHIKMISLIIVNFDKSIHKICLVVDNDNCYRNVDQSINLKRMHSEQDICREFLKLLAQIKPIVFIIGFNSSSNLFGDKNVGYDLPFIINRSNLNLTTQKQSVKINGLINTNATQITKINQLPNVYCFDFAIEMRNTLNSTEKCSMSKYKLNNYLELYGIHQKQEIGSYQQLQSVCSQKGSQLGDIINYCVYDSECLMLLENSKGFLAQKLAQMTILQQPLSNILYKTTVHNITNYLQQQFVQSGYLVQYTIDQDKQRDGFKGAFTETKGLPNKVYHNVIDMDFQSFYPSSIIAGNICLSTILNENNNNCNIIDVLDDENAKQSQYFYSKEIGIIPKFMQNVMDSRISYKKLMKQYPDNAFYNNMQLQQKLIINSCYGLLGSKFGLLYFQALPLCVTAQCRTVIQATKQILEQNGSRVLAIDTDACFAIIPEFIRNGIELSQYVQQLNDYIHQKYAIQFTLCYEEIIKSISFIDGKKSYIGHFSNELNLKEWNRDSSYGTHLICKGFNPSLQSEYSKLFFYQTCNNFLNLGIDAKQFFLQLTESQKQLINSICDECDFENLQQLTKKVKQSGKSLISKQLQLFGIEDEYIHCVKLQGPKNMNTSQLIYPVQLLTNNQIKNNIDREYLLEKLMSDVAKFLLDKSSKKLSKFKSERDDLCMLQTDGQIIIREEYLTKSQYIKNKQTLINFDQLYDYSNKHLENTSIHELITQNQIKLFFDIDTECDIIYLQSIILKLLSKFTNQKIEFTKLKSTGNKFAYHIFTNLNCSLENARLIGNIINQEFGYDIIDISVYYMNKSLRIPNSYKIDRANKCIIPRCYKIDDKLLFQKCFVQNLENSIEIQLPIHYQQKVMIDDEFRQQSRQSYTDKHQQILSEWLIQKSITADLIMSDDKIQIRKLISYECPIHNKVHDNENLYAKLSKNKIVIYCYRSTREERKLQNIVLNLQELEELQPISQLQKLVEQQHQSKPLQNAIIQNNRYLQLDEQLQRITFIKSALGTGKTRFIENLLQSKKYSRILILSHRRTFTQDMKRKYGCISYIDINGIISLNDHQCVIVQLESLQRVIDNCDLLIIDEIESILQQLNGGVANSQNAQQQFLNIVKNSQKMIICDGYLQQTTIDTMNYFINDSDHIIHENICRPYTGNNITIIPFTNNHSVKYHILESMIKKLQSGIKITSMVTSNKMALFLQHSIELLGYNVICYTGCDTVLDSDGVNQYSQKHEDFKDVNTKWRQCDILIYTSTLTAGVDFNQEHFDEFIHVYCKKTCDSLSFVQGIGRIRKFNGKQHTVYFQEQGVNELIIPSESIRRNDLDILDTDQLLQFKLFLESRTSGLNYYRSNIVMLCLQKLGYTLQYVPVEIPHCPKVKNTNKFIKIVQSDLDLYESIQKNKDILLSIQLPRYYNIVETQIKSYLICKIKLQDILLEKYNDELFYQNLLDYSSQIVAIQKSIKLGNTIEDMQQHIIQDKQFRDINQHITTKQVDYLQVKKILINKQSGVQLFKQLGDKSIFTKNDLIGLYDFTNSRWITLLEKHCNSMHYTLYKSMKKSNGKCNYTFSITPITEVLLQ